MLAVALANLGSVHAETGAVAPVSARPSLQSTLAAHSVLLGIARAGKRLVAVGERGIIVLSDDSGRSWTQASVPVSVTLTAVNFPTPAEGWAVGHSGVILHSVDGGEHWTKQLDGVRLAKLALTDAQANVHAHAARRTRDDLRAATELVEDGPDKPFFFVRFDDARHGTAGGADGIVFRTTDAGMTWSPRMSRINNPSRRHLYGIARQGKIVYLVGEQGYFARSVDGGENFARLRSPYRGTFFAVAAPSGDALIIAGLRGHAYSSHDRGRSFRPIIASSALSFSGSDTLADGTVILTDDVGTLFRWRPGRDAMSPVLPGTTALPSLTGVAQAPDRALVTTGLGGANRLEQPD